MLQVIKESFILFVACGVGGYTFKELNGFLKISCFQAVLGMVNYAGARAVTIYQKSHDLPLNNQWVFNIYILLECGLLLWAGYVYFNNKRAGRYIIAGFVIFLVIYVYQLSKQGFLLFANYAFLTEGIVTVSLYIFILFGSVVKRQPPRRIKPEFWLSLGLIMYFAGNVPYMGLVHYFQKLSADLNTLLFYFITDVLGNLRYLMAAISFWLYAKK